jgi:hypothetical protein
MDIQAKIPSNSSAPDIHMKSLMFIMLTLGAMTARPAVSKGPAGGPNGASQLHIQSGARFNKMTEAELLAFIPKGSSREQTEALAALFLRFAKGRRLRRLARWSFVWNFFPKTDFDRNGRPYEGGPIPPELLDDDDVFPASITVHLPHKTELYMIVYLSESVGMPFEMILRGRDHTHGKCRVLTATCWWRVRGRISMDDLINPFPPDLELEKTKADLH